MTVEDKLSAPKRRTRAEVQKLAAEFVSSGMRRSEFCRSRGLSFGTLNRHLKKRRWKRKSFFKSPDGRDWLLYHANSRPRQGCGWHRAPRAQPFTWQLHGTPDFGKPVTSGVAIPWWKD